MTRKTMFVIAGVFGATTLGGASIAAGTLIAAHQNEAGGSHHGGAHHGATAFVQAPDDAMGAGAGMRLDANGDGRITRDEMRAQADRRFDRLDTNKDGAIDRTELQAQRAMGRAGGHRGMMRQGMDDMPPPPAPGNSQ